MEDIFAGESSSFAPRNIIAQGLRAANIYASLYDLRQIILPLCIKPAYIQLWFCGEGTPVYWAKSRSLLSWPFTDVIKPTVQLIGMYPASAFFLKQRGGLQVFQSSNLHHARVKPHIFTAARSWYCGEPADILSPASSSASEGSRANCFRHR